MEIPKDPAQDLCITGSKDKILSLLGIFDAVDIKDIVLHGGWSSPDSVDVSISSALVSDAHGEALAQKLVKGTWNDFWLPSYEAYEDAEEHAASDKKEYEPLMVRISFEGRLDINDPLGTRRSLERPGPPSSISFTKSANKSFCLSAVNFICRGVRKLSVYDLMPITQLFFDCRHSKGAETVTCRFSFVTKPFQSHENGIV